MEQAFRSRSTQLLLPLVIGVVVVLLGIAISLRPGPGLERAQVKTGEQMGNLLGLTRPVKNALAPQYQDLNADLIADTPIDASAQLDPSELTFSYVATDENATLYPNVFQPLMDAMSRATGRPVRYLPITDVAAQIRAVADGTLHVSAFNTGSVPDAVDVAGFVPVAVLGDAKGATTYEMLLLASTRTSIRELEDVKGQEVTLTQPSSNSGGKMPMVLLNREQRFLPGKDYTIRYSGGHEQSIDGLVAGRYDVIAVASDVLARAEREGRITSGQYRILSSAGPFPTACFGFAHQLRPELAAQIRDVLINATFENNALGEHFAKSGQSRLVPIEYARDFALVRELDDAVGYQHVLREPTTRPATRSTTTPAIGPATKP
jgi:phosphonate transport system substrate-binding protein